MADEMAVKVARGMTAEGPQACPDGSAAEPHCGLRDRMRYRLLGLVEASGLQRRGAEAMRSVRGSTGAHLVLVASDGGCTRTAPALEPRVGARWLWVKRGVDIGCAGTLLMLLAPVMFAVALCVSTSGQPILFRQARVGRNGRLFKLVKFRTMVPDAEARLEAVLRQDPARQEEWIRTQKLQDDPRITVVGSFLRHSSLDELPQLFNVLAGDMSLVGPRPVVPDELARYGASACWYTAVKPGVTGLWQVSGRNDTCYTRRVALDVHYVRSQKLWLDAFILLKTVYVVLLGKGAH